MEKKQQKKPEEIAVGDACKVNWKSKGKFYDAKIRSINENGDGDAATYNIDFADGDKGKILSFLLIFIAFLSLAFLCRGQCSTGSH